MAPPLAPLMESCHRVPLLDLPAHPPSSHFPLRFFLLSNRRVPLPLSSGPKAPLRLPAPVATEMDSEPWPDLLCPRCKEDELLSYSTKLLTLWTNDEESTISSLGRVVPPNEHDGQVWVCKELRLTWSHVSCVALMVATQTDPLGDKDKRCHWHSQCKEQKCNSLLWTLWEPPSYVCKIFKKKNWQTIHA